MDADNKRPNYNTPAGKLERRFAREPELAEAYDELLGIIEEYGDDPDLLEESLKTESNFELAISLQQAVTGAFATADHTLDTITTTLAQGIFGEDKDELERYYVIRKVCDGAIPPVRKPTYHAAGKKKRRRRDKRPKTCTFMQIAIQPVFKYVLENKFIDGSWEEQIEDYRTVDELVDECPDCGKHVSLWSTANRIVAPASSLAAFIDGRLKSDGRRNAKFTELVCGEELRNMSDDYAFLVVMDDIDKFVGAQRDKAQAFIKRYLGGNDCRGINFKKWLGYLGVGLPQDLSELTLTQRMHYAMFCYISTKLDYGSIASVGRGLDNYVIDPYIVRDESRGMSGELRVLRTAASTHGTPVEFQIMTRQEYVENNLDPRNVKFHLSYAVRERREQMRRWGAKERVVNRFLNEHCIRGR